MVDPMTSPEAAFADLVIALVEKKLRDRRIDWRVERSRDRWYWPEERTAHIEDAEPVEEL